MTAGRVISETVQIDEAGSFVTKWELQLGGCAGLDEVSGRQRRTDRGEGEFELQQARDCWRAPSAPLIHIPTC